MKFTDAELGRQEKAKWGKPLGLDEHERETHPFTLLGTGELIMNIYGTRRWCSGNKMATSGSVVSALGRQVRLRVWKRSRFGIWKACYLRCTQTTDKLS